MKTLFFFFLITLTIPVFSQDSTSVLFVGNSFTFYNNMPYIFKDIATSRKGCTYLKCPAHTDFLRNTWIFCAPFDLTIEIEVDPESDMVKIYCENISQEIFESIVDTRFLSKSSLISSVNPSR